MSINKKARSRAQKDKHLNWMGGAGYFLSDPIATLRMAAASCFFGEPMYYHRDSDDKPSAWQDEYDLLTDADLKCLRETLHAIDPQPWRDMKPAQVIESAVDAALDFDPERTLQEAARLRNEVLIRVTPQVILVRAANHANVRGTGLIRVFAPQIIKRADEPATGLAYQLATYGTDAPIPNALKKAWAKYLGNVSEYQLAKYKMGSREVKTVDVVNLTHAHSDAIGKLVKGKLKTTGTTWESIVSAKGSSKATWREALGVMGHMALLRNLRNLLDAGVAPADFIDKLVAGATTGKQLPFRYYLAHRAIVDQAPGSVLDAVETCLTTSLGNLPTFKGRVMSLCDNSGSALSASVSSMGSIQIATIANLTGILTGMRAYDGHLGIFGDGLETFAVRKAASVFDQLDRAEKIGRDVGAGTEHGIWLFWDQAIRQAVHWDHVFVYSDMQAGHGRLFGKDNSYKDFAWNDRYIDVGKLINEYRAKVNPKVNVYLVQVAGYKDTILPEFYERTYMLGGWSAGILRFAEEMAKLADDQQPQQ